MENKKIHLFIFSLFVAMGAYLTTHSWGGITYVYLGEGESRLPAAVGKGIDFSELKGSAFSLASRQRILQEARLIYQGTDIGVELGHFITKSQNGEKAFACNKYSTVQLQFVAVGIAESGESPVMEVEGDCVIGKSIGKIEPIWVPAAQLLSEIPANMELQINEPYHVNFKFDHIGSQWPKTWVLHSLNMYSKNTGETLTISNEELRETLDQPLRMIWSEKNQQNTDNP